MVETNNPWHIRGGSMDCVLSMSWRMWEHGAVVLCLGGRGGGGSKSRETWKLRKVCALRVTQPGQINPLLSSLNGLKWIKELLY